MKNITKLIVRIAMLVLATALLMIATGCKNNTANSGELPDDYIPDVSGKINVTCRADVYSNESTRKAVRSWVSAFMNKYPDTQVEINFNVSDYTALISSKSIGDVFFLTDADTYKYAVTNQALMALDYYIELFNINTDDVYSGINELCKVNGRTYFTGMCCGNVTFAYNVDAMVEAGLLETNERIPNDWTWDDFKVYAEALKTYDDDGVTLTQVGAIMPLYWSNIFSPFLYAYGGEWYNTEEKKVTFFNEGVIKGIGEVINAIDNRWICPTGVSMSSEMRSEFAKISDTQGSVFNFISAYTVLQDRVATWNANGVTWDVCPFPLFEYAASPCGTLGFGVFSYTNNPDAAAALVLTLYTEEGQIALHGQEGGDIPVLKKLGEQDFWHLTGEQYEGINFSAFTANYDRYVAGQVNGCVPQEVATLIEEGMEDLYSSYCQSAADWTYKLQELETQCNETWESLK